MGRAAGRFTGLNPGGGWLQQAVAVCGRWDPARKQGPTDRTHYFELKTSGAQLHSGTPGIQAGPVRKMLLIHPCWRGRYDQASLVMPPYVTD